MVSRSPWLVALKSEPTARRRLVCFPHAGGGSLFFRNWPQHVEPDVEVLAVVYPGREHRMAQPPVSSMDEVAHAVAEALAAERPLDTVLFGHSMGASIAYETLRLLEASGRSTVRRLCVSARRAVCVPDDVVTPRTEAEVITMLRELGGTHVELLEDPGFRAFLVPIMRNDYLLVDSYRSDPEAAPLTAEVTAFAGDKDPRVTPEEVAGWAGRSAGAFRMEVFPGGHFYLADHVSRLLALAFAPVREPAGAEAVPGSLSDGLSGGLSDGLSDGLPGGVAASGAV